MTDLPEDRTDLIAALRKHGLLPALLRSEVIAEAVKQVNLSEDEAKSAWEQYLVKNQLTEDKDLQEYLHNRSLSESDLRWQIELPIRIDKYSKDKYIHKAEARFLSHKESMDIVVYSLLRTEDPYLAREFYFRISGREANFSDLASEYSEGYEAKTKGIIGPVPMTRAHPLVAEKLRTSSPGELLEPFKIDNWWLVLRLERYEPAQFNDATALQMSRELFNEWVQDELACRIRSHKI